MGAALKVDMNKAYDRISWDFLWQVLKAFGFPPSWIHIIQQCVSTVSYQVLVNGNPTKVFRPIRGLRQGDPLSSYLFVLCMEVFSAMIRKAESDRLFRGIKVCRRSPSVSHLFFADDALIFFQPSPVTCLEVNKVLHNFCDISGQMINLQNSFIRFSSNVPDDYRDYLAASMHVRVESSIGSYLGLPVDISRHKCKAFQPLIDKVVNRLSGLTSLHLSSAAKLVIINSVLVTSFNHILSVFKIPSTVIDKINNLLLRFWWKSSSHSRGIVMASSSLLYRPKGLGGLGLRHLGFFNSAMLAKQAWGVMHNPQILISRIFQARYPSILDRHSHSSLSRPSWAGNSLMHGFRSLQSGLTWKIGNGSKIHRLFDSFTAAKILSLERPAQLMDDFVYWIFTRDGNFSTKSAYAAFIQGSFPVTSDGDSIPSSWWKKFWAFPILPKWKMFFWKLLHGVTPVEALLCTKGIPVDPLCAFCHTSQETIDHLFLHCPFTRRLWSCGPLGILLPPEDFSSFIHWIAHEWKSRSSSVRDLDVGVISPPLGFHHRPLLVILRGSLQCLGGGAQACFALSAIQAELFVCLLALRMAQNRGFAQLRIHTDCLGVLFSLRDHCSKDIFAS
ncbi:uncharacterized protein LOC110734869 [Chenopodium quinoa]|uniref:uncharacterized protein LOC110734869 n=1 Tax=Chenopodium quinoa TaxID=63459 RepID=UPI000B78AE91|nr:uncharacterized protein LOC110734869 [Chenopodium quinoa]